MWSSGVNSVDNNVVSQNLNGRHSCRWRQIAYFDSSQGVTQRVPDRPNASVSLTETTWQDPFSWFHQWLCQAGLLLCVFHVYFHTFIFIHLFCGVSGYTYMWSHVWVGVYMCEYDHMCEWAHVGVRRQLQVSALFLKQGLFFAQASSSPPQRLGAPVFISQLTLGVLKLQVCTIMLRFLLWVL